MIPIFSIFIGAIEKSQGTLHGEEMGFVTPDPNFNRTPAQIFHWLFLPVPEWLMKSLGCLCYFITGIPPAPCTSKRRRRLYPHDGNPSQDPCTGLRFYFPLYSWCKVKAEPNFLSLYILTFISRGAYHSRRRWTWSTVPGPPQDPCTGFFHSCSWIFLMGKWIIYIFFVLKKNDDVKGLCLVPASSMERACVQAAIGGRPWFRQCALSPKGGTLCPIQL